MPSIVVATRNAGKLRELRPLLGVLGFEVQSLLDVQLDESTDEDGLEGFDTFEANAESKARYFAERLPGRLVLAEDSGLEVDALDGAPGVRSKRWRGATGLHGRALDEANNAGVLEALAAAGALGEAERSARYTCAMASSMTGVERPDAWLVTVRASCEGRILLGGMGEGGFGYDPLFWSTDLRQGFGVSSRGEKARVSHRGRALRQWIAALEARGSILAKRGV